VPKAGGIDLRQEVNASMEKEDLLTTSTNSQSAMIGKARVPDVYDVNFTIRGKRISQLDAMLPKTARSRKPRARS